MRVFDPALSKLLRPDPWSVMDPMSFQEYVGTHVGRPCDTASMISVDSRENLQEELRTAATMVVRLGSRHGRGTEFSLIRTEQRLDDYFLIDEQLFGDVPTLTFLPEASMRSLYPFWLVPEFVEASLVNLSLASGALAHALALDAPYPVAAPARGQSTYSFEFQAHTLASRVLRHENGQVEVDAVFVGRRRGQDCLFVVEAKAGRRARAGASLAKHKLVYPVLALATHVPQDMPIIPVYLRASADGGSVRFRVAECAFPDPRTERRPPALNELEVRERSHLVLPLPGPARNRAGRGTPE